MIRLYSGGFALHRWGFRVRLGLVRGLAVGLEWRPGPWRESPATHSSLVVSLLVFRMMIEHAQTRVHTRG